MDKPAVNDGGFTLLEMAIVLIVLGYLMNQILTPFGARQEQARRSQTLEQMAGVLDSITGYAISRQRLPCPAGLRTHGLERSACTGTDAAGFVPAVTLGINGPVDKFGRLLDSWGRPLLYAVSQSDHPDHGEQGKPDFLTQGEMSNVGFSNLSSDLVVCLQAAAQSCARNKVRANQVPVLVLSLGADASTAGQQAYNQDHDSLFVSREKSLDATGPFDDLVLWLSESRLIFELVRSGTLN